MPGSRTGSTSILDSKSIILQEFRETISDLLLELEEFRRADWYLTKYLEEYRYDIKKATASIRTATKWRQINKIDSILEEDTSDLFPKFPYDNDGRDKNGRPILVVPFGKWNIREAVEQGLREKFIRYVIQMTEINLLRLRSAIERSNGETNQVVIIFDLTGYSFKQIMDRQTISTLSEWTKRSEEQYPMHLKRFYVINANKIMPILFSLLKPFMSATTVSRVMIFDSNREQWQKVLFSHIPTDQISPIYGGSRVGRIDEYYDKLPITSISPPINNDESVVLE